MLTFKQFINENLESYFKRYPPYETNVVVSNEDGTQIKFTTEENHEYLFTIEKFLLSKDSDISVASIEFVKIKIESGRIIPIAVKISKVDNQVEAIRIFTTVLSEINKYHQKNDCALYYMSSDKQESSRIRLYDTFIPMLAKEMGLLSYRSNSSLSNVYYFMVNENILDVFLQHFKSFNPYKI